MIQKVLIYPHPRLQEVAAEIAVENLSNPEIVDAIRDIRETLRDHNLRHDGDGAALAATQVGIPLRVVALGDRVRGELPDLLVNPKITFKSDEKTTDSEGCLSFPGLTIQVPRHDRVVLEFQTTDGFPCRTELSEFLARCLQHEIDHLDGIVFIDHLPRRQKFQIHSLMLKHRLAGRNA
jgi:peptide deformylase